MIYIVDRMEDGFAVLQDDQEGLHTLPLAELPADIFPGSVLLFENGVYTVDVEQTRMRRERMHRLQERLRKR